MKNITDLERNLEKISETFLEFRNGKLEGNLSSEFTTLIQAAGRYCEHYASDLLYDIRKITDAMDAGNVPKTAWFGFREMGVDHLGFIKGRLRVGENLHAAYRAMYVLGFTVIKDGLYAGDVQAVLYRVRF